MKSQFNTPSATAFRPTLNAMEDRLALSGSPVAVGSLDSRDAPSSQIQVSLPSPGITYDTTTHVVKVQGSSGGDVVNVVLMDLNGNGTADGTDKVFVTMVSPATGKVYDPVLLQLSTVSRIDAQMGNGDDTFDCDARVWTPVRVDGGAGNDRISGGAGADILTGGYGNDTVYGRDGADVLYGDLAYGTPADPAKEGNDYLNGGAATNTLFFGGGVDDWSNLSGGLDLRLDVPESLIPR